MAKKQRSYENNKKEKNPNHVGTITHEQQRKWQRAAVRMQRIAMETHPGQGVHGDVSKRSKNRADRRDGKRQTRTWDKE
jgi:hypothetical protein